MGFCCCATWYSNWMLNRDFRLMIRVECISARAWLRQGQPRFLKQIAENLEESLRARFFLPLLSCDSRLAALIVFAATNNVLVWLWFHAIEVELLFALRHCIRESTVYGIRTGRVDSTKRVGQGRGRIISRLFFDFWNLVFLRFIIYIYTDLHFETLFQSNPSSKHVSRSISKADTIFIVGLSRLIISDSYILIGTAL